MELFDRKVLERIARRLVQKKMTVAVAESVTGGLIQFAFSTMDNAMQFLQGGICVYNLGQKYKHLNVEPIHAQLVNCVSPQVAKEMSISVAQKFNSNFGISITGYATAVPESKHKIYAYYSIARSNKEIVKGKISLRKMESMEAQLVFVNTIMQKFENVI